MPAPSKGRRKPVVSDSSESSSSSEGEQSNFDQGAPSNEQLPAAQGLRRKARPSLALPQTKSTMPKNAAGLLIRKSANAGRRLSAVVGGPSGAGGLLADVEGASRESMEEMSLKFEEWMKMATDNVRSFRCLIPPRFARPQNCCSTVPSPEVYDDSLHCPLRLCWKLLYQFTVAYLASRKVNRPISCSAGCDTGRRGLGSPQNPSILPACLMRSLIMPALALDSEQKITVNNTWKFALIDYFADLTLLRNGPGDDSVS